MSKINPKELQALTDTISKLVNGGFRFTVINNSDERIATIVSATKVDQIKHAFPDFYIYLSSRNEKLVERVFNYGAGSAN